LYIIDTIIRFAASKLKIPDLAVRMFKASSDISAINKSNLPTELIPLNTIQLSRGLLNYTVLQSIHNWILPYWVVKQYSPKSSSFVPRSHTGHSINVTNRNWTAAGTKGCNIEPIVDPSGLITPFRNGWSIDFWLYDGDEYFFPSYSDNVYQRLINDLPIIENSYDFGGLRFVQTVFVKKSTLRTEIKITNNHVDKNNCKMILSIRPYNPEGISLLNNISYVEDDNCFRIGDGKIYLDVEPKFIYCSDFNEGDAFKALRHENKVNKFSISCDKGLATSIAVFDIPSKEYSFSFHLPLEGQRTGIFSREDVFNEWELLLNEGSQFRIPDKDLNSVIRTSLSTLLTLIDNKTITPGPFTYHQFWFRDAAFMIFALDKFNFTHYTNDIIENFPSWQDKNGFFRSQKGEWDSNGQAVWTVYQHFLLTKDIDYLNKLFPFLLKGIRWIERNRTQSKNHSGFSFEGLLPKGLSAEHLGLADYYFWDNFWSLAGIKCFIEICEILNYPKEKRYSELLYTGYLNKVKEWITFAQEKFLNDIIGAGPGRDADYGMIGSVIPLYPLQQKEFKLKTTLDYISNNFLIDGMFYQNFIHSGLNAYLTLQLAHSYLYLGDRKTFNKLFNDTIKRKTRVNNFPEAIHPITGGGCMGDGHHGWAAAEIVSAFRDMFLWEDEENKELKIFSGIPTEWFNHSFMMNEIPVSAGKIRLEYSRHGQQLEIKINIREHNSSNIKGKLVFPFEVEGTESENISKNIYGESEILINLDIPEKIIVLSILVQNSIYINNS
jgi:hypothetical protein